MDLVSIKGRDGVFAVIYIGRSVGFGIRIIIPHELWSQPEALGQIDRDTLFDVLLSILF